MIARSLLLVLFLSFPCFADVKAIIEGPTKANTGDLVVLTTKGSVGDNFVWIMPETLQVLTCDADQQIGFASGRPGVFKFTLIAADKEASIDYITHTVTIGSPPEEPGHPPVTPAPDLSKITEVSKNTAPSDPEIAKKIKEYVEQTVTNIDAMCSIGNCPPLTTAQATYQRAIGNALGTRPRGDQTDWITWRKAVEAVILEYEIETVEQLKYVMQAVIKGL